MKLSELNPDQRDKLAWIIQNQKACSMYEACNLMHSAMNLTLQEFEEKNNISIIEKLNENESK